MKLVSFSSPRRVKHRVLLANPPSKAKQRNPGVTILQSANPLETFAEFNISQDPTDKFLSQEVSLSWKDFFHVTIYHHGEEFFKASIPVKESFDPQDLKPEHFAHFNLSPRELKKISLKQRKILIRHCAFHSEAFAQITQDFLKKVNALPGEEHRFATHGAGMYLFLKAQHLGQEKRLSLQCQTSEIPFALFPKTHGSKIDLHMSFRPEQMTYFGNLPSLWQDSWTLELFEIDDCEDQVA